MSGYLYHTACSACGSTDNVAVYVHGDGHCFGCGKYYPKDTFDVVDYQQTTRQHKYKRGTMTYNKPDDLTVIEKPIRGITPDTLAKYGCALTASGDLYMP
jgi:hypothetical protein